MKKGQNTRPYTDEQRLMALQTLMQFGGNVTKTADFLGIPYKTIQSWKKSNPVTVARERPNTEYADSVEEIVTSIEVKRKFEAEIYLPKIGDTIDRIIKRYETLIPLEKDMNKLTNAMQALIEAANTLQPRDGDQPNSLVQFIQNINGVYVQKKEE
jgi:hypothetical protein